MLQAGDVREGLIVELLLCGQGFVGGVIAAAVVGVGDAAAEQKQQGAKQAVA